MREDRPPPRDLPRSALAADRDHHRGERLRQEACRPTTATGSGGDRGRVRPPGAMVDDLLDLSRIEAGAVNPRTDWCDLADAVARAAEQVQAGSADASDRAGPAPDLPLVRADAAQLERVFSNLLENAVKFSPAGAPVRVSGGSGGGRVTVRVTDAGPGIPPSRRARSSSRSSAARAPAGLGAGSRHLPRLVEANGGEISLQAGAGKGTHVRRGVPAGRPAGGGGVSGDGQRVLVVDDEPQIVRGAQGDPAGRRLRRPSRRRSKREALDAVAVRPPDAMVLDLILPDGSGVEVCEEVRRWSAPADHRALRGWRRAREGPRPRCRRRRLHHKAVRDRRAARPAARRAPSRQRGERAARSRSATWTIDLEARQVTSDGEDVHLTPIEFDLLRVLARTAASS